MLWMTCILKMVQRVITKKATKTQERQKVNNKNSQNHKLKNNSKVLSVRFKSYIIWVWFVINVIAIRQLLVSDMHCENICFESTAPAPLWDHLYFRLLPVLFLTITSGHLFPDWFGEFILPVDHRYMNCKTSQWWRNLWPVPTACVRQCIPLTLNGAEPQCIVAPSVASAPSLALRSWETFNFSGRDGSVSQSDRIMQIYVRWRYLDSAQWNHLCGTTRENTYVCQKRRPAAGDLIMEDKLIMAVGNGAILYDQSLYRDTNRRDLAWRELSLEVGEPGNIMFRIIFDLCILEYIATTGFDWLLAAPGSVGKFHAPIRQTHLPLSVDGRMQWATGVREGFSLGWTLSQKTSSLLLFSALSLQLSNLTYCNKMYFWCKSKWQTKYI